MTSLVGHAQELPAKKITLFLASVETAGTRAQNALEMPQIPAFTVEPAWTEEQIASAPPLKAMAMIEENMERARQGMRVRNEIALQNYRAQKAHMEGILAKLQGTRFGSQVLLALDKFAGFAAECFDPDCLEFFHRMDTETQLQESFLGDTPVDLATAAYFLKLVFDNPHEEKSEGYVSGTHISRKKYQQKLTYEVQDMGGKMITAGNVTKEHSVSRGDAGAVAGEEEGVTVQLVEECLKEVAQRINTFFVAKVTVKLVSSRKGDGEFNPEAAVLLVDGEEQMTDTEFSLVKGKHLFSVELEGYTQKGGALRKITKGSTIKIVLAPEIAP
ncbi:MAG: hypothetical protein ACI4SG_07895 [Oligosphaeraceae bacterium]